MAGSMAEELRIQNALDHDGTVRIGRHQILRSGPSIGGLIPHEYAGPLGAREIGETEVFVNFELGVIMHRIPDAPDE